MGVALNLKETIKTLVLAPSVAFLSYVATNIITAIAVGVGAFPSGVSVGTAYPLAVAGVSFAIVLIRGIDDIVSEKPSQ